METLIVEQEGIKIIKLLLILLYKINQLYNTVENTKPLTCEKASITLFNKDID